MSASTVSSSLSRRTVFAGSLADFTVLKGEAQVTRAGESAPQPIAAGPEVVGHAGDVFYVDAGVVHSARSVGDEPAVLLTAGLLTSNMPSLMPTNDEGTPTP